jgi:hypothetical protein
MVEPTSEKRPAARRDQLSVVASGWGAQVDDAVRTTSALGDRVGGGIVV